MKYSFHAKIRSKLSEETLINILYLILRKYIVILYGKILSYRIKSCGKNPRSDGLAFIEGSQKIIIGENFSCGKGFRVQAISRHSKYIYSPQIRIGDNVNVNDHVHIACASQVTIMDNCLLASKIIITDHNHGYSGENVPPIKRELVTIPVIIEENVWIGENVVILPGVTIGKNSVIGANSVVVKSIAPNSIAVGVPARVIKHVS